MNPNANPYFVSALAMHTWARLQNAQSLFEEMKGHLVACKAEITRGGAPNIGPISSCLSQLRSGYSIFLWSNAFDEVTREIDYRPSAGEYIQL
jgi:hypothetical protein